MKPLCSICDEEYNPRRAALGHKTCLSCGEKLARAVRHTVVPMHKSNYQVITDLSDLKGINNKGGLYR